MSGDAAGVGHLEPRDREPRRGDRVALDLDEVVQPRRQRLPLLDVRRLAVGARSRGGGRRRDQRRRRAAPRRTRPAPRRRARPAPATRTASRAGNAVDGAAGATITRSPSDERRDPAAPAARARRPARRTSPANGVAAVRERPQRRLAVRPARADDLRRRPSLRAASGVHSPSRQQLARSRRCTAASPRSSARSRSFQPTHAPKTFSQTSIADAVQPRAVQLLAVVAVPAARVVEHVPLLEPARAEHARHARCRRTTAPTRGGGRRSRASGSVDSPSNATPGPTRRAQPGPRLLHRVEEDAVGAELAHELGDRLVRRRPARGACRRPTGCSRRRRARRAPGRSATSSRRSRARRGRSRTGCARRSRSPDRRARARRRRSRRTRARPRRGTGRA